MSMDLLLDTDMLLWLVRGDQRAEPAVLASEDDASTVTISAVSYVEVAVKHAIGKLPDRVVDVRRAANSIGVLELPFTASHAEMMATLPLHHRDPFDRMLIAQALSEDYVLVSSDRAFAPYDGLQLLDGS
jgi:PIN domain nuclease of toxin-antitoxin system